MVCYFYIAYFDCFLHIPNDNKFRGKKYLYNPQGKTGGNRVLQSGVVSNKNPGLGSGKFYLFPVLPKPPLPRAVSVSSAASSKEG